MGNTVALTRSGKDMGTVSNCTYKHKRQVLCYTKSIHPSIHPDPTPRLRIKSRTDAIQDGRFPYFFRVAILLPIAIAPFLGSDQRKNQVTTADLVLHSDLEVAVDIVDKAREEASNRACGRVVRRVRYIHGQRAGLLVKYCCPKTYLSSHGRRQARSKLRLHQIRPWRYQSVFSARPAGQCLEPRAMPRECTLQS